MVGSPSPVASPVTSPVPTKNLPQTPTQFLVGSDVQVLYSDGKYYRAKVVEVKGDQCLVKYVDYNQQEWKDKSNIKVWKSMSKFLELFYKCIE